VPTYNELNGLVTATAANVTKVWTTNYLGTGINGYLVTQIVTGSSLFLPAAGTRLGLNGNVVGVGPSGYYWSSGTNNIFGCGLTFYSGVFTMYNGDRADGFTVRCVAEP
jgi:hypothetical protein